MNSQQGDILLLHTLDDGEISVSGGIVQMCGGLETAVYLSLFGGNEDDGRPANPRTWWGNLDETDPARQYRSETQYLLRSLPATSSNLLRIEDAAKKDLAWLLSSKAAASVAITASMPGINKIKIVVDTGGDESLEYIENWKAN